MKPSFRIIDLLLEEEDAIQQIAALLVDGFKEHWPDMGNWEIGLSGI